MTSETAVIIAALGGAAIGGAITLATNWINKRSEERKQLNSLFVNAGIENWKQGLAHAQRLKNSQEFKDRKIETLPLDAFIINMLKLSEVLQNSKLTKSNIIQKLKEMDEINKQVNEYLDEKSKSNKANSADAKNSAAD